MLLGRAPTCMSSVCGDWLTGSRNSNAFRLSCLSRWLRPVGRESDYRSPGSPGRAPYALRETTIIRSVLGGWDEALSAVLSRCKHGPLPCSCARSKRRLLERSRLCRGGVDLGPAELERRSRSAARARHLLCRWTRNGGGSDGGGRG